MSSFVGGLPSILTSNVSQRANIHVNDLQVDGTFDINELVLGSNASAFLATDLSGLIQSVDSTHFGGAAVLEADSSFTRTEENRFSTVADAIARANDLIDSGFPSVVIKVYQTLETQQLVLEGDKNILLKGDLGYSAIVLNAALPANEPFIMVDGLVAGSLVGMDGLLVSPNGNADYVLDTSGDGVGEIFLFNSLFSIGTGSAAKNVCGCLFDNTVVAIFIWSSFTAGNTTVLEPFINISGGSNVLLQTSEYKDTMISNTRNTYITIDNMSSLSITGSYFRDTIETAIISDGGDVFITNTEFTNCEVGISIDNNSRVSILGCNFELPSSTSKTLEILDNSSVNFSNSIAPTESIDNISPNVYFNYFDESKNNFGNTIIGNSFFGSRQLPANVGFGQANYPFNTVSVLKFNGTNFTDVTSQIIPDGGATITLFDNLTTSILYIGDDEKFSGFTSTVSTIEISNTLDTVFEYWNGATWVIFNTMNNQSINPFTSYSVSNFNVVETQDLRFSNNIVLDSPNPLATITPWAQTTVNSIMKYWVRYRIVNPITQSAAVSNFKFRGNTRIITDTGIVSLFGKSRYRILSEFDFSFVQAIAGLPTPANQDIWLAQAPALGVGRTNNSFTANDHVTFVKYPPFQSDTSTEIELIITYYTSGADTNTISMQLSIGVSGDDILLSNTQGAANATIPRSATINFTLTPNIIAGASRQRTVNQPLMIGSRIIPRNSGDVSNLVWFHLERLADANANALTVVQIGLSFTACFTGLTRN